MSRRTDNSNVPHTCPKIDTVIDFLENAEYHLEQDTFYSKIDEMVNIMEQIRTANIDLREFGNRQLDEKEECEKDKDDLEKELRQLKSQVLDMEYNISDLENTIKELQEEIYELS